jgi:hypothetical protein
MSEAHAISEPLFTNESLALLKLELYAAEARSRSPLVAEKCTSDGHRERPSSHAARSVRIYRIDLYALYFSACYIASIAFFLSFHLKRHSQMLVNSILRIHENLNSISQSGSF